MSITQRVYFLLVTLIVAVEAKKILRAQEGAATTGKFIVKLSADTSSERFDDLVKHIESKAGDGRVHAKVDGKFAKIITARLSVTDLEMIKDEENVEYIEEETMVTIDYVWHLDRINQRYLPLDGDFSINGTGYEVDIYILDTGIRYTHDEFEGRALYPGYDPVDAETGTDQRGLDCQGHGTHVAGLAGGITYGAATESLLYSVRVLSCTGSGTYSGVINGINYAATQISSSGRPGVINMSLGGGFSQAANDAVEAAVASGAHVVVAAGNSNADACNASPASAPSAITVGATAFNDYRASFSNIGTCVDIFAPGQNIESASYECDSCTVVYSGTSMASPITAGVVATILEANPTWTPAELTQSLIDTATPDVLFDVGSGSPNILVYAEAERIDRNITEGVRLVNGRGPHEGRVEVLYDGRWGTVCDDAFGITDADVVCRELGYSGASNYSCCAPFGEGTGDIWLDEVSCTGNEASIYDCPHNGFGYHDCSHYEDVGVVCGVAQERGVRLVNGSGPHEGRVEVLYDGRWGTVCDDAFGITDADVVCRELGYFRASAYYCCSNFGEGTGNIWLDDVSCTGNEASIYDCPHNGFGNHDCRHYEDVGVVCETGQERGVRLAGYEGNFGRVEILYNGEWGTVCDDGFTTIDADVVCRELGYPGAQYAYCCATYGEGTGAIWLDDVACSGSESSLYDCPHDGVGVHNCVHGEDVGVMCESEEGIGIRLAGGCEANYGRLEVFYNGEWGTVCDDGFSIREAHVACRQLGYSYAAGYSCCATYGEGTGEIWLDDVDCSGSESSLSECSHNGVGVHNCGHYEDVGIACI